MRELNCFFQTGHKDKIALRNAPKVFIDILLTIYKQNTPLVSPSASTNSGELPIWIKSFNSNKNIFSIFYPDEKQSI